MTRANRTAGLAVVAAALALLGVSLAAWARWSATQAIAEAHRDATALADRAGGLVQTALATARLRAEGVAAMTTVRAAIESDAATVHELARVEGFAFAPAARETIELFQVVGRRAPASLLRTPVSARPLTISRTEETRLDTNGGVLTVLAASTVEPLYAHDTLKGAVAVASRVELAPLARSLASSDVAVELVGAGAPLRLSAPAPAPGARVVMAPLGLVAAPSLAIRATVPASGGVVLWMGRMALLAAFLTALWMFVEHRRRRDAPVMTPIDDAVTARQDMLGIEDDSAPTHPMGAMPQSHDHARGRSDGAPPWGESMPTPITRLEPAWQSAPIVLDPRGDQLASRYRLLQPLGSGASGDVYLAQSFVAGVPGTVALKLFGVVRPADRDAFVEAARRQSCVRHPSVVQVFDVGSDDIGYVAMEYVEGCTLEALLRDLQSRDEPLPLAETVAIVAAICRALDAAMDCSDDRGQRQRLVHGAVKPSNVLLGRHNAIKLGDFGAPPSVSDRHAPERFAGKLHDRRSDVYAVGLILHELCTGRRVMPPPGDVQQWPPLPTPTEVRPGLPRLLDAVVSRATRFGPRVRYATAGELLADLEERVAAELPATSAPWLGDWVERARRSS